MTENPDLTLAPGRENYIVTLCGSARFEEWFHVWMEALGRCGVASFGLTSWPSRRAVVGEAGVEVKATLDEVHRAKIRRSDGIVLLNVFGYMGESTLAELRYARQLGRDVYSLESWGVGYGIGPNHRAEVRAAARAFGVPEVYRSPVDVSHGWGRDGRTRFPFDLLGEPGARRHDAVALIHGATKRLEGSAGA